MTVLYENTEELKKQISFVSHEIRNNISICDMYSQILKKHLEKSGIQNASVYDALNCIQKSIQLIGANLADLKAFSQDSPVICDLKRIVCECCELSKAYISDVQSVDYNIEIGDNIRVYADKNRLLSCILNIFKNAIEAIDSVGTVTILAEKSVQNVVLKIANNGSPIPSDVQKDIFNYGYTTKETGSGFGLCLTKQYLESQNATLNLIKSDADETVFEIVMQLAV